MKPRLLIFELRRMGDAVLALPFVRAARERYEVGICCSSDGAELFRLAFPDMPLYRWDPPWQSPARPPARTRDIVDWAKRFDASVSVCSWADPRVHWLMARAGSPRRVGFRVAAQNFYANHLAWRKRQLFVGRWASRMAAIVRGRRLLTDAIDRSRYSQHHVEDWRHLAERLELPWKPDPPWLAPPPVPAGLAGAVSAMKKPGRPLWLIHPGARMENRRWPIENFARVIREGFVAREIPCLVIRSPEVNAAPGLPASVPVIEPDSLAELAALVAAADRVLCNDTGVLHLASAFGKPVLGLFSANLPAWFGPLVPGSRVVNGECPYRPCFDRCLMPAYVCLSSIRVETVLAELAEFP